jgi:hypothetical protein
MIELFFYDADKPEEAGSIFHCRKPGTPRIGETVRLPIESRFVGSRWKVVDVTWDLTDRDGPAEVMVKKL